MSWSTILVVGLCGLTYALPPLTTSSTPIPTEACYTSLTSVFKDAPPTPTELAQWQSSLWASYTDICDARFGVTVPSSIATYEHNWLESRSQWSASHQTALSQLTSECSSYLLSRQSSIHSSIQSSIESLLVSCESRSPTSTTSSTTKSITSVPVDSTSPKTTSPSHTIPASSATHNVGLGSFRLSLAYSTVVAVIMMLNHVF
jgi:hypothetical protein